MKIFPDCNSEIKSNFNLCSKCNNSFTEQKIADIFEEFDNDGRDLNCLRCEIPIRFTSYFNLHKGSNWMGEILENKETFDFYLSPKCGKVEFFSPRKPK